MSDTEPQAVKSHHHSGFEGYSVDLYQGSELVFTVYAPTQARSRVLASAIRKTLHKAGLFHDLVYKPEET